MSSCALLHDIGDTLGSYNHADVAAVILKPFISEENHWIIAHHGIFQGYYFFHYLGLDRNMRDEFKDHPYYAACAEFCRLDQAAFDPDFTSMPIEAFEPMGPPACSPDQKPRSTKRRSQTGYEPSSGTGVKLAF